MAKLTTISKEMQEEALRAFSPIAVEVASAVSGGVGCTQKLLEMSVGVFRASDIISRVSPQRPLVAAMQQIAEMDPRQIFNVLRHEHLQTIALVVSFLPPEKASQLLSLVHPDRRAQVVQRLATLSPTSIEVVEGVAEELQLKLSNARTSSLNYTGGVKVTAKILNALPKNISDSILVSLQESNVELSNAILKKMFTFEELQWLEAGTRQKILQEADKSRLAVALKTASPELKASLLSCISKRAAENVKEEISMLGPLKLSEIEAAQTEIIETVRRLESQGEIDLDEIRQKGRR
jgi:flagellar motor switch protein FliG